MEEQDRGRTHVAGVAAPVSGREFVVQVFAAIADRVADRGDDIARFAESTASFQPWLAWESLAALSVHPGSGSGCTAQPRPRYATVGVPGSRDVADLLVADVATAARVLIEIVVIDDWSSNKWIENLDGATRRLSRPLVAGVVPLQIVVTASHTAPIDVNRQWQQWLGMSRVWNRETPLRRTMPLGAVGQLNITAWDLSA